MLPWYRLWLLEHDLSFLFNLFYYFSCLVLIAFISWQILYVFFLFSSNEFFASLLLLKRLVTWFLLALCILWSSSFLSESFAQHNLFYELFLFLIEFVMLFVIQGSCFLFWHFEYLKVAFRSNRLLSSSRNFSKEKLTFSFVLSKDFQSFFNRLFLKSLLFIKFLNDLLNLTLLGSFFKILGVIRTCAWWSEMSVIRFRKIAASLTSLKNML